MTNFEPILSPVEDAAAVEAVRGGDLDKYGELVERHARRVYAVAWSRLGDAALAEEAAQEAFIRGYRRLVLLGDGGKFASWIGAIARNVAINLGIRHRRELNKRARWALEVEDPGREGAGDLPAGETLRQALEALPAAHRECLVLFYLEGKSGTEAAAALGIGESAFRVRLHRARAALREQLDQSLAESLTKLGPSRNFTPAVLAALAATGTTQAAATGAGTAILGGAAKILPGGWLVSMISWMPVLPVPFFAWLYSRLESRNFQDPNGFRARLLRQAVLRRLIWLFPAMIGVMWIARASEGSFDLRTLYLVVAVLSAAATLTSLRLLAINRNRYFTTSLVAGAIVTAGAFAIGLRWVPISVFWLILCPQMLLMARIFGDRPIRMDYNLFLRALEGQFELQPETAGEPRRKLARSELMAFARFLGDRWLVTGYAWSLERLRLWLTPPSGMRWGLVEYLRSHRGASFLDLGLAGEVTAGLAEGDRRELGKIRSLTMDRTEDLERQTAVAVAAAWQAFRCGKLAEAERALGERTESELFKVSPTRSGLTRWYRRLTIGWVFLALALGALLYFRPPWMEGLAPVQLDEADVRAALQGFEPGRTNALSGHMPAMLSFGIVLPTHDLFTPEAHAGFRSNLFEFAGVSSNPREQMSRQRVAQSFLLQKALAGNLVEWEELGLTSADMAAFLRTEPELPYFLQNPLGRRSYRAGGIEHTLEAVDLASLARLRILRELGCLELLDREKLIGQIANLQVLSGEPNPSRPAERNWRDIRGLFVAGGAILEGTYTHLAALEILGALDRIDREACVRAMLKMHRGRGYLVAPETDERWRLNVRGDARDTYCAFESLRILGALDRVKDLPQWEFRVKRKSRSSHPESGPGWAQVEAWLLQRQFREAIERR